MFYIIKLSDSLVLICIICILHLSTTVDIGYSATFTRLPYTAVFIGIEYSLIVAASLASTLTSSESLISQTDAFA